MRLDFSRLRCLGEAFEDALLTFNSNVALIEMDRRRERQRWGFLELRAEARRLTALLQSEAIGLEPGGRCAILMQNQGRWVISGIAALWSGAVLVPLDYKLTAPEQAALLQHARPTVLIVDAPRWRALQREDLPEAMRVLVVGEGEALAAPAMPWESPCEAAPIIHHPERDDVACIVYSSGTGGTPKGCQLSHHNYLSQAEVLGQLFPMEEGERYFSILPTNHAIDFMCGFCLPLMFGGTIVHQMTLRPEFLVSTLRSCQITHMALVPMILKALERRVRERLDELEGWKRSAVDSLIRINEWATARKPRPELSRRLLRQIHEGFGGRLKLLFCGGAFVDRGSAEFFNSLGLPVVIGYGLTEAGTVITVNDLSPFRGDTVGRPIDGTEVELRDLSPEGIGEVWVRGPTVMTGYLDEPELTAEAIVDGWLRTGDLGRFDAAGHLQLVGRARNLIVTEGGKNVYPEDLEASFEDLDDGVEELCVFAANYIWPQQTLVGEELAVVLRCKDGEPGEELLAELRRRNARLADYKRISRFVVWDKEFPRTASMKVKRRQLAERIRAGGGREDLLRSL